MLDVSYLVMLAVVGVCLTVLFFVWRHYENEEQENSANDSSSRC